MCVCTTNIGVTRLFGAGRGRRMKANSEQEVALFISYAV